MTLDDLTSRHSALLAARAHGNALIAALGPDITARARWLVRNNDPGRLSRDVDFSNARLAAFTRRAKIATNRLFLKHAVALSAASVGWLADRDTKYGHATLTPYARAKASVDLLVWGSPSSLDAEKTSREKLDLATLSATEIGRLGNEDFASAPIIPRVVMLGDLCTGAAISPPVAPVLPELKANRVGRLTAFLRMFAANQFCDRLSAIECARMAVSTCSCLSLDQQSGLAKGEGCSQCVADRAR